MTFEQALTLIKTGKKVCRAGPDAGHAFIYLHKPGLLEGKFTPYVALRGIASVGAPLLGYNFSSTDVLTEDWYEVSDKEARALTVKAPA
ncbi:Thoeris anti-defense Tad2 family protein [Aeromonas hydrophila]|uniref:Thoeris anti-defense Tad2 family protein n=1 Tax=Aeromonas hydrophila TaxID=644 RepID=UPI003D1F1765